MGQPALDESGAEKRLLPLPRSADGEYWFDVRTVDRSGQVRPQGPHTPKLVVVVDTVPPKVQLAARLREDGRITASFHMDELYLRADSVTLDYRVGQGVWQGGAGCA